MNTYTVQVASEAHFALAESICHEMAESAKARGTGIAKRTPEYLKEKMSEGKAIIATDDVTGEFVGFCYIETWQHGNFVANSGLIVKPDYRKYGVAKAVKMKAFELSRSRYPNSKIIGITTSLAVMKINSDLGYEPTTFSELPVDDNFWKGCESCVNYDILTRTERKICLCTGMIYDANQAVKKTEEEKDEKWLFLKNISVFTTLKKFKEKLLMPFHKKGKSK
jgi:Acetyltransferase (GNAT) family